MGCTLASPVSRNYHKFGHYFPVYDRHVKYAHPISLLEIGVETGGSLRYWKQRLPGSRIVGLDHNSNCLAHESPDDDIHVVIGGQTDVSALQECARLGPYDVVIDDASHKPIDQMETLKHLWPQLNWGGTYIIEDCIAAEFYDELASFTRRLGEGQVKGSVFTNSQFGAECAGVFCYPLITVIEKNAQPIASYESYRTAI